MSTRRHFLWLAVAMIAGVAGIWSVTRQNDTDISDLRTGTAIGEVVPNIPFSTIDGDELATKDLRGKVVVVNAFASWCGPCRAETPDLVRFYQANKDKIILIGLNVGENELAVAANQQEFTVPYPLVLDPDGKIAELFRPRGLPTSWFIDPQGIVQAIQAGPMTGELMDQIITKIQ